MSTPPKMSLLNFSIVSAACALLLITNPAQAATSTLTVRASASMAGGLGPIMQVRINGTPVGTMEIRASTMTNYNFSVNTLAAGAKVDVVFTNDAVVNGEDRNLYVAYLTDGSTTVLPNAPGATLDRGLGNQAFDGLDVLPGQGNIYWSGALRLTWPASTASSAATPAQQEAARLLQQATFGPTTNDINRVVSLGQTAWLAEQLAMPYAASYVPYVQKKYDAGDAYRPGGSNYTAHWVSQRFWANAATAPDQLRQRMAFALHQILTVSQADSNLWHHARGYAQYLDQLNQSAFGNYRQLLENVALNPVTGIYLSHLRNRKENPATGLLPDENFAREVMQLFSIGLQELNPDGSLVRNASGQAIETYGNADVMAMARVFTGWSWGFPDAQLTEQNFRWGAPGFTVATDQRIDLLPMKPYPGQHSTAESRLFAGKPWAVTIPANTSATESLRLALNALFNHPNVGPFIGRQLIQHLVTSNPSPAYVARVSAAFNNNGKGVRGDMAAVTRAILQDSEARGLPGTGFGKLREPVLRVAHWMRAFGATSVTGDYMMAGQLEPLSENVLNAPSVFGYFRPGYVPPNTRLAETGATAPEFQIVNESTTAAWVNMAESMTGYGLGWTGSNSDVRASLAVAAALVASGNVDALIQHLNTLLFTGRMSRALQLNLLDAVGGVNGTDAASQVDRARVALYIALSSPEYLVQR